MDSETFVVDRATLYAALDLYKNITAADAIFKPCQDKSFRQHMKSCIGAVNVQRAFKAIADLIGEEV